MKQIIPGIDNANGSLILNLPWKLDIVLYELIQEPALKEHIDRAGISSAARSVFNLFGTHQVD